MSAFEKGQQVRVAKVLNDPYGEFSKAVVGKTGPVEVPGEDGLYGVRIPGEGFLIFHEDELEAVKVSEAHCKHGERILRFHGDQAVRITAIDFEDRTLYRLEVEDYDIFEGKSKLLGRSEVQVPRTLKADR